MSIKDRQIAFATEDILKDYLTSGRYPEAVEIQQKLTEKFQERIAGLPRFNPHFVREDELSNPEAYNEDIKNIAQDLKVSFYETNWQANRLLSVVDSYEVEKRKMEMALKQLEDRIERVKKSFENPKSYEVLSDSLNTFYAVDFEGDTFRGIPKTNTLVDLRYGQILLENIATGGTKYNLSGSDYLVKLSKGKGQGKELLSFGNIFRDSINEAWEYRVTSTAVETTEVTAVIELNETIEATNISLHLHSPKSTQVKLEVSDETESFREMMVQEGIDKIEWKLDEKIKFIRFTFTKNEPDFSHETLHEYQFGATNLSITRESYLPQGYFVSRPFIIPDKVVSKIKLSVRDVLFPRTNIRYYIGMDDGVNMVEWQEIEPDKTIEIQKMSERNEDITVVYPGYAVKVHENFGVDFYQIGTLPELPEEKSVKIHMGNYMWKVDTISGAQAHGHAPSLSDWLNPKNVTTMLYPIEKTLGAESLILPAATCARITAHIYCDDTASVLNNRLTIDANTKAAVYVNNTLLKPVVDSLGHIYYNYRFQKGWNVIQILTHTDVEGSLKANLYLKDIASEIYAIKEALTEVSLYDLYNNVSKKDYTKFAVNGNKVIVNYNPKSLDSSGVGVKYHCHYRYATDDLVRSASIRFMAMLTRSETNEKVSPILKKYELIVE